MTKDKMTYTFTITGVGREASFSASNIKDAIAGAKSEWNKGGNQIDWHGPRYIETKKNSIPELYGD